MRLYGSDVTDSHIFAARYLSGDELWGDDFELPAILEWFESEREGYANLGTGESGDGHGGYHYHAMNRRHGYRHLRPGRFGRVLGIGSAYGLEFVPIAARIDELTILEPSEQMRNNDIAGVRPNYVMPSPSGTMPFADSLFDLAVCLGTLHHIPNVSHVVKEIGRVLRPGGYALIREPIVSMGDWRTDRGPGCTQNERGIPWHILRRQIADAGLRIEHEQLTGFPLVTRMAIKAGVIPYNSGFVTLVDGWMASAARRRYRYHAQNRMEKLRPTGVMMVCVKD